MKCPHCQNEVKDDARYCPQCGYHLHEEKKTIPIFHYVMGGIVVVVFIFYTLTMTMLNRYFITPQISSTIGKLSEESGVLVKSYDSLESFNKAFDNANQFISPINSYTKQLSDQYHLSFKTSYSINYYSNENIQFVITSSTQINKDISLQIVRKYDRRNDDTKTITFTKRNCQKFEDLKMKEIKKYVAISSSSKLYNQLVKKFESKHSLFDQKRSLGHYGIGVYQDDGELVYYSYEKGYKSQFVIHI